MVLTHCHFLQKAAWGRARVSSYCTYSFFNVARYANRVARDAITVSREGGNLLLSSTVCIVIIIIVWDANNIITTTTILTVWFVGRMHVEFQS